MQRPSILISVLADAHLAQADLPIACPAELNDRYDVVELVHVGERSWLYRGRDRLLSDQGYPAPVAIKVFRTATADRDEALAARRVEHTNVVRVLDRGRLGGPEDALPFVVLEWAGGGDLSEKPLPWRPADAARTVMLVARAAQAAHVKGVIHRDIKPQNILLTTQGEPKLADFELACVDSAAVPRAGTIAFMAPEQHGPDGGAVTAAADVYALGGVLYYLLSGRCPNGETREEAEALFQGRRSIQPLTMRDDLARICMRALSPSLDDRHRSAGELADDLDAWLGHRPIPWTRPGALKTVRLWTRRRPAMAALAVFLVVSFVVGSVVGVTWREQLIRKEVWARAESERLADLEVRERSSAAVENLTPLVKFIKGLGPQEQALPLVAWLEMLGHKAMQDTKHNPVPPSQLRSLLGPHLDSRLAQKLGREDTETCIFRLAIGHLALCEDDPESARTVLLPAHEHLSSTLPPSDGLALRASVLLACAEARIARGEDAPAAHARLDDLSMHVLSMGVGEAIVREVERTRSLIRASAPRGSPASR